MTGESAGGVTYEPPAMRHTKALRYSRRERLHFRLFGRWPDAVVQRRLLASELDRHEAMLAITKQEHSVLARMSCGGCGGLLTGTGKPCICNPSATQV